MFGLGKKDKDGRQVRIEHRGKNIRASRTGGVAARVEKKVGPVVLLVSVPLDLNLIALCFSKADPSTFAFFHILQTLVGPAFRLVCLSGEVFED